MSAVLEIPVREKRANRHHPVNTSKNTFDSEKLKDLQTIYSAHPGENNAHQKFNAADRSTDSYKRQTRSQTGLVNKSQKMPAGAVKIEDAGVEKYQDQVTA